ncbi:hypothetical protein HD554DRAFT_2114928 [Boletus coccyginus]|nr:hypothetical protein HD554DRAFT_2114928 [Boletus coccyginus]
MSSLQLLRCTRESRPFKLRTMILCYPTVTVANGVCAEPPRTPPDQNVHHGNHKSPTQNINFSPSDIPWGVLVSPWQKMWNCHRALFLAQGL